MFASLCESFGLFHVDFFFKVTIEKCNFDVHLMNLHVFNGRKCKDTTNWHKLCNICKSFSVIDSKCLCETFCHKSNLVTFDFTIDPCLILNTHLQQMGFLPLGSGTKDQMLLITKESYFSCMAISHFFASSLFNTFSTVWSFSKKAMMARSTSLVATHQSQGHSLHYLGGLFFFIHLVVVHSNPHLVVKHIFFQRRIWCRFITFHVFRWSFL